MFRFDPEGILEFTPVGSLGFTIAGLFGLTPAGLLGTGLDCNFWTASLSFVLFSICAGSASADELATIKTALIINVFAIFFP